MLLSHYNNSTVCAPPQKPQNESHIFHFYPHRMYSFWAIKTLPSFSSKKAGRYVTLSSKRTLESAGRLREKFHILFWKYVCIYIYYTVGKKTGGNASKCNLFIILHPNGLKKTKIIVDSGIFFCTWQNIKW